jgi:hypothetical protein
VTAEIPLASLHPHGPRRRHFSILLSHIWTQVHLLSQPQPPASDWHRKHTDTDRLLSHVHMHTVPSPRPRSSRSHTLRYFGFLSVWTDLQFPVAWPLALVLLHVYPHNPLLLYSYNKQLGVSDIRVASTPVPTPCSRPSLSPGHRSMGFFRHQTLSLAAADSTRPIDYSVSEIRVVSTPSIST